MQRDAPGSWELNQPLNSLEIKSPLKNIFEKTGMLSKYEAGHFFRATFCTIVMAGHGPPKNGVIAG